MKILVLYKSKHGSTKSCVQLIKDDSHHNIELREFQNGIIYNLDEYDHLIIAGSVYYGKIQKQVSEFIERYKDEIKQMKYSLILCCGNNELFGEQLANVFGDELVEGASRCIYGGHGYDFADMNFMEKIIVKKVSKVSESMTKLNYDDLKEFIQFLDEVEPV